MASVEVNLLHRSDKQQPQGQLVANSNGLENDSV